MAESRKTPEIIWGIRCDDVLLPSLCSGERRGAVSALYVESGVKLGRSNSRRVRLNGARSPLRTFRVVKLEVRDVR
jgi:hypothetical protein